MINKGAAIKVLFRFSGAPEIDFPYTFLRNRLHDDFPWAAIKKGRRLKYYFDFARLLEIDFSYKALRNQLNMIFLTSEAIWVDSAKKLDSCTSPGGTMYRILRFRILCESP